MHLLRNSFRYASRRDRAAIARDLKPVYTAASEAEALEQFAKVQRHLGGYLPGDRAAVGARLG